MGHLKRVNREKRGACEKLQDQGCTLYKAGKEIYMKILVDDRETDR